MALSNLDFYHKLTTEVLLWVPEWILASVFPDISPFCGRNRDGTIQSRFLPQIDYINVPEWIFSSLQYAAEL